MSSDIPFFLVKVRQAARVFPFRDNAENRLGGIDFFPDKGF
jgi:hypothetical protein